jgi:hypothetical protein
LALIFGRDARHDRSMLELLAHVGRAVTLALSHYRNAMFSSS